MKGSIRTAPTAQAAQEGRQPVLERKKRGVVEIEEPSVFTAPRRIGELESPILPQGKTGASGTSIAGPIMRYVAATLSRRLDLRSAQCLTRRARSLPCVPPELFHELFASLDLGAKLIPIRCCRLGKLLLKLGPICSVPWPHVI